MAECSIPGCGKPFLARGWCSMHYARWYTHNDVTRERTPRLLRDGVKRCKGCGVSQGPEAFADDATIADGKRSRCRPCERAQRKERRKANPGKDAAYQREWLARSSAADPEFWKKRYAANRENNRKWAKICQQNRRATRIGLPADLTACEWADRVAEYGGRCAYCLTAEGTEQDHMTPISRGGAHTLSNVVPACRSCNARKGAKTILEYAGVS